MQLDKKGRLKKSVVQLHFPDFLHFYSAFVVIFCHQAKNGHGFCPVVFATPSGQKPNWTKIRREGLLILMRSRRIFVQLHFGLGLVQKTTGQFFACLSPARLFLAPLHEGFVVRIDGSPLQRFLDFRTRIDGSPLMRFQLLLWGPFYQPI